MKCAICGNNLFTSISVIKQNKIYYRCQNCDYIFINPSQIISAAKEKERYLSHQNSPANEGYVKMLEGFFNEAVFPFHSNIKTALDFGCGPEPVLANILEKINIETDIYDLLFFQNNCYKYKKYDLITLSEVLEHLKNPLQEIRDLAGILNKDGILAIMTMFYPADMDKFINWWYIRDITHISFFNQNTLKFMAKKLGLEIVYFNNKNICTLRKI